MLEYGNEITIRSNADSPNTDFFQQGFETMRRKRASTALALRVIDDGQRFLVNTVVDQPSRPALTVR